MRTYLFLSVLLTAILLPLGACRPERDRSAEIQAMIQQEVDRRLNNYREVRLNRCEEDLLKEAVRRVDSILLEEARLYKDTVGKPPKPLRPERPELRPLLDTTPVRPLLPPDSVKNRN